MSVWDLCNLTVCSIPMQGYGRIAHCRMPIRPIQTAANVFDLPSIREQFLLAVDCDVGQVN